ncbi:6-phosphogluconolactonase [Rudaea sp.]|jgi:6-phosphogluconolactonase|uniref:6-phosphogluconolactonase n=1 Tax=Rudaea sp. TaxID=2136325 RepID=UPI0039C9EB36
MTSDCVNMVEHSFASAELLADALAAAVAADLQSAISTRGRALLAVSGGKTPTRFLAQLSRQPLAWKQVTVTLVDERWVAPNDARSNEGLVRATLLQGAAAAAHFVSLYATGFAEPETALPAIAKRIALLDWPFDALVLGMGEDGHCASFFPDGDHLAEATDPHTDALVLPMRAPGAGEPRITLTLPVVLDSRAIYLHIEGERKRRVLQDASNAAESDRTFPISQVLRNARAPLNVYWCA